jgi:hypothetical protein
MVPGQEAIRASVIVPNWNGAKLLHPLLESLRTQDGVAEVIVVDNGSGDQSIAVARKAGANVIALPSNRGFAFAVNRGIEAAAGEWLAIINNDVELSANWIQTLAVAAIGAGAWFATGKLLDSRRRDLIDGTYDAISVGGTAWRCGAGRPDGPLWSHQKPIQMAPLTAILIRKDLFDQVGLLDETFESYLEDVEFGLRCAIHGFSGIYVPDAKAYHRGSATLGRWHGDTVRRISRNQVLLVARHYPAGWIGKCGWKVLAAQLLWGLVALRHGAVWPWIRGKIKGMRMYRANRRPGADQLLAILQQSESEIRELQRQTGQDLYWKLYFALT